MFALYHPGCRISFIVLYVVILLKVEAQAGYLL